MTARHELETRQKILDEFCVRFSVLSVTTCDEAQPASSPDNNIYYRRRGKAGRDGRWGGSMPSIQAESAHCGLSYAISAALSLLSPFCSSGWQKQLHLSSGMCSSRDAPLIHMTSLYVIYLTLPKYVTLLAYCSVYACVTVVTAV
jgi:hypothetical protein